MQSKCKLITAVAFGVRQHQPHTSALPRRRTNCPSIYTTQPPSHQSLDMTSHHYEVALFGEFFAKDLPGAYPLNPSSPHVKLQTHLLHPLQPSSTASPSTANPPRPCTRAKSTSSRTTRSTSATRAPTRSSCAHARSCSSPIPDGARYTQLCINRTPALMLMHACKLCILWHIQDTVLVLETRVRARAP